MINNRKENASDDGIFITAKYVFFYASRCPFSNFYQPCRFSYTYESDNQQFFTHWFFSSEQAFMWHKAKMFKDEKTAIKILTEGKYSPKFCKVQGRLVRNYDDNEWSKVRYDVFLGVNLEKFRQNENLRKFILDSRFDGKTFAEASPYDRIWGTGMKIDDPKIVDEKNWKGQNLLGKVITQVREELKKK